MTILVVTLLALVAIAVLIYPFWAARHGNARPHDHALELAEGVRRARERVYEEIRALQQEYFLGVLTPEEHEEQLRAARLRAAELVREQQQVENAVLDIERQVDDELGALLPPPSPTSGNGDEEKDEERQA